MSRIIVRNSCIIIRDYTLGENPYLEKNFQIWNQTYFRYEALGMYYDEEHKLLYLPRGVDIWKIRKYFKEQYFDKEEPNPYKIISNIEMKYGPKDEEQKEALKFMLGIDEYMDNYDAPQLSVNLTTGKGKTYCSIATIGWFKINSVIIAYSNTLLSQWKEEIKKYTNLTEDDILFISGSPMMNMILNDKSKKALNCKVFLITHGTIRSFCETYGWNKLNIVFKKLGIGMKFFDEAHTNFANMLMIDFFSNVYKTYYVTATPKRSDWREDRVFQLAIKNIPGIDLFDSTSDPHTDYLAIKYNSKPTAIQVSECRNMYGLDRNKYVNYVTRQPNFYKVMSLVMDMIIKANGRALIYIGTNEGVLRVYKWICENYPQFIGDIGIYTSLVDKDDKLIEKNKKILISTTKSAGLGEHIEGLKMTVLAAEPFKSEVLARQTLGRTRDSGTLYIELVDMGFRNIQKFYYEKLKTFNKYASSTSDTFIDQYELDKRYERLSEARNKLLDGVHPLEFLDPRFFECQDKIIIIPLEFGG